MKSKSMITVLLTGLAMVAMMGCGSGGSTIQKLTSCSYDFTADVRSGPNAGVRLVGKLVLGQTPEGNLLGRLTPTGKTDHVMVTGKITTDTITLQFWFKDGIMVKGTGPHKTTTGKCQDKLDGDLVTPVAADKGDWLATALSLDAGNVCVSGCTFVPTNQQQCVNTCIQLRRGITGSILSNFPSSSDSRSCEESCAGSLGTFDCSEGNTFGGTCG